MKKYITRTIHYVKTTGAYHTSDGRRRDREFMWPTVQPLPTRPYKVTYALDPKGPLVARLEWVCRVDNNALGFVVCFLPDEWYGMRVTRKVTLL